MNFLKWMFVVAFVKASSMCRNLCAGRQVLTGEFLLLRHAETIINNEKSNEQ